MRIGIITDQPFKDPLGYSIRPRELAIHLSRLGCEVHVFSPVDIDFKISSNLFIHGFSSRQDFSLYHLHKLIRKMYKSPLIAHHLYRGRVLGMLASRLADYLYRKVESYHIEILQGEKEIASMAALSLGKRLDIPVVADIHGLLVEEAVQCGLIKPGGKEFLEARKFVSDVIRTSDAVVVVSEYLKDYLTKSFNINCERVFVIPNAGSFRNIVRPFRTEPHTVVYAGILESWERVDLAIKSMLFVTKFNDDIRLLIAGTGSLRDHLAKLITKLKLDRHVDLIGAIPYERIANFLVQGDVAVLPSTRDIIRMVACPIKLFDYLAVGLPIVTVDGLWWSDLIRSHNVGLVTEDRPEDFANAITELLSNPDKINIMSENAVKLVKHHYNWTKMAKRLLQVYENIL